MISSKSYAYQTSLFLMDDNSTVFSAERINHINHLQALYYSVHKKISDFSQIIEYGAGTGDNVPLFKLLGFIGVHFI